MGGFTNRKHTYERIAQTEKQQVQMAVIGVTFTDPDLNEPNKV